MPHHVTDHHQRRLRGSLPAELAILAFITLIGAILGNTIWSSYGLYLGPALGIIAWLTERGMRRPRPGTYGRSVALLVGVAALCVGGALYYHSQVNDSAYLNPIDAYNAQLGLPNTHNAYFGPSSPDTSQQKQQELILTTVVAVLGAAVLIIQRRLRSSRRSCPDCRKHINTHATICPHCRTVQTADLAAERD